MIGVVFSSSSFGQVVISEISAFGHFSFLDYQEEDPDWIEIENQGGQSIDLQGWSLSDKPSNSRLWTFPEKILFPGQRVVVFASGKDGVFGETNEIHTNFRLNSEGETLVLTPPDGSNYSPDQIPFPGQRGGYTYGTHPNRTGHYFLDIPTPGNPNQSNEVLQGVLSPIAYSPGGGLFEDTVTIQISKPDPVSEIYYTLDYTNPNPQDSFRYEGPIEITETSVLRAAAFRAGRVPSPILTQTFWIGAPENLKTLPVLSMVFDPEDLEGEGGLRGTDGEGNPNAIKTGPEWERPVSVQYIDFNDSSESFTINAGARMHGNNSQRIGAKPSFRMYFRDLYDGDKLKFDLIKESDVVEFDAIVIRGGHQDSRNPFIQDELARRLYADMGQVSSLGTFVHLLINGIHYGYYNPVERYNVDFFQQKYDSTSEWDVVRNRELGEGSFEPFADLFQFIKNNSVEDPNVYREVSKKLDLINLVDYLLLNIYGSTWDWPGNNVTISHESTTGGKVRYHVWDAEGTFGLRAVVTDDTTQIELLDGTTEESNLFLALTKNSSFIQLFASRFRTHFYEGGSLTNAHVMERFLGLRNEVVGAIPTFIPTVAFAWAPHRRHYMMAHLYQHGLIQDVGQPVTDQPPVGQSPPRIPIDDPNLPDLDGDGIVNSVDLSTMLEGYRNSPRSGRFGSLLSTTKDWSAWNYPVGVGVRDIKFVDLDGDHLKDLIAVNGNYGRLLVLKNLGGGLFSEPDYLEIGLGAEAIAIGDINGDGWEDIVTGNDGMTSQTLTVLLNSGKGGVSQFQEIEVLSIDENEFLHTRQIQLADLDHDGLLDVLVGFHSAFVNQPNATAILFGDGAGSFSNRTMVETGITRLLGPGMTAVADLDSDQGPEAVVLDGNRTSVLLRLNESRQLLEPVELPQPGSFEQVTLDTGDLDLDGYNDLVFGDGPNGSIRVLFNSGSGVFSSTDSIRIRGIRPENILVADLTGDDLPEIIAANLIPSLIPSSTVQVFWNEGNREFTVGDPLHLGTEISFPGWLASGDVDGDGFGDFAVSDEFNGSITVFLNRRAMPTGDPDLTHDGYIDIEDLGIIASEWQTVTTPR